MGFDILLCLSMIICKLLRLYLMKNCSELFSHFRALCAQIHLQFHLYDQNMRSDNAKEYMSKKFQSFMLQNDTFIRYFSLILFLQMELLKEKIDTFLKPMALLFQIFNERQLVCDQNM